MHQETRNAEPSPKGKPIRLLIVEDQNLFAAMLLEILTSQPDLKVLGTAASAAEAETMLSTTEVDVIMLDLMLPDRSMQGEFLRMSGHEVTTATDGNEALAHAGRENFDLMITDIIMPDRDGIEVIVALRKTMPALKVIAISGGGRLNAKDYLNIAQKLGASATLAKPFSGSDLVATVERVLAG